MNKMTVTASPLANEPGRIHNLTPAEEQKLMQMWSHVLVATGRAPSELVPSKTASSVGTEEPKKKSGGFFSRKKEEVHEDSPEAQKLARAALAKAIGGMTSDELHAVIWKMFRADNPDNLLLRFLRARKWNVADALAMFGETLKWRLEYGVEEIIQKGELEALKNKEDGFLLQYRSKKAYCYGHDLKGRPIVHVRPRFHDPKTQSDADVERFTVMIIENSRLCLRDPVDTAAVIFDLSDFSLSNMDYPAVKFIIKCFEGHYPESLGFVLIHKAPWIFQGIWNIIKSWIDPVVAAKISFTRNHADMAKFIPDEFIPQELGGRRKYEYEYIEPEETENILQENHLTRDKINERRNELGGKFEDATLDWIQGATDEDRAAAQKRKNEIAEQLRESYWEFDPYYRARAILDRNHVIKMFQKDFAPS
ncbi:phosphatidylinositol transfer protein Csr1p [Trichomonascus vanleenenianus]|uniref:Csr1p n=1 Tax=Trichomonascus vanleenenianus TaxID=2268995 RepID=UPI003EC984B3